MPPQVLPGYDGIKSMMEELLPRGFVLVQGLRHLPRSAGSRLPVPPHPREGAEAGFMFRNGDLAVFAWTTWVPSLNEARKHDCGWIIIEQAGRRKYSLPIHRTKRFIERLIMEAKIARTRIRNAPICEKCGKAMRIVHGKGMGSRYWRCPSRHSRAPWDTEEFLAELPDPAKKHLARRRSARHRGQEKARKKGKPIRQAQRLRHAWTW